VNDLSHIVESTTPNFRVRVTKKCDSSPSFDSDSPIPLPTLDTETLDPLQHASQMECCEELLQECEPNPVKFFGRIVTGDETWVHDYDSLSRLKVMAWKKSGEDTPTRASQQRSAGKIMLVIFWDIDGVLLTHYLTHEKAIDGSYYTSFIEQLRVAILKKTPRQNQP
jgi:hypothetical protein